MIFTILVSNKAQKQLRKVPQFIRDKLEIWVQTVQEIGLEETRKIQGYHDEPLKGVRKGQRSIRLNRAYRVIYKVLKDSSIEFVNIEEVHKHEY